MGIRTHCSPFVSVQEGWSPGGRNELRLCRQQVNAYPHFSAFHPLPKSSPFKEKSWGEGGEEDAYLKCVVVDL